MEDAVATGLSLLAVLVAVDVLLGWVQPEPGRWPRRLTHMLTEPLLWGPRRLLPARLTGGWDLSPLLVIVVVGVVRVWLIQP